MKILGLIMFYAVALFVTGWLLLDVEAMLVSELTANKELDIPENVLLDALEDMRYWNRFSVLFTFLILIIKCFLMALVLYAGLFFCQPAPRHPIGKPFPGYGLCRSGPSICRCGQSLVGSHVGILLL